MAEQLGTGLTISFASGFFATVLDVDFDPQTRESIKSSHMGTTDSHTWTPSKLIEQGGATVELLHDGTKAPPIDQPAETFTVGLPDGTGFSISAFMDSYKFQVPMEDMIKATAHLKFSGPRTNDLIAS